MSKIDMPELMANTIEKLGKNTAALEGYEEFIEKNKLESALDIGKYIAMNWHCWREYKDLIYHYSTNRWVERLFTKLKNDIVNSEDTHLHHWLEWISPHIDGWTGREHRNPQVIEVVPRLAESPFKTYKPHFRRIEYNYDFETLVITINSSFRGLYTWRYSNVPRSKYEDMRSILLPRIPERNPEILEALGSYKGIESFFDSRIHNNPKYKDEYILLDKDIEGTLAELYYKAWICGETERKL